MQTPDGGYLVTGWASSNDFDFTDHHGSTAKQDAIVIKLDSAGRVQWKHSFGGSEFDGFPCMTMAHDGGYLVAGGSASNDGDITDHHGDTTGYDAWIVKCNTTGTIEWQKSMGGSQMEGASGIVPTRDGGCAIAANTRSTDGDLLHNTIRGGMDCWIIKLGNIGSSGIDDLHAAIPTDASLAQNFPNPFSSFTQISYEVPSQSLVTLSVFDCLGREMTRLVAGKVEAGAHTSTFDASSLPAGIYFLRIGIGSRAIGRVMQVIK